MNRTIEYYTVKIDSVNTPDPSKDSTKGVSYGKT